MRITNITPYTPMKPVRQASFGRDDMKVFQNDFEDVIKALDSGDALLVAHNADAAIKNLIGIKDKIGTHTLRKTFGYHAHINSYDITLI